MGRSEITDLINQLLKQYEMNSFNELRPNLKEHLINIESYFQRCLDIYQNILADFKEIDLSTRGISSGSGVGKSTIYNQKDVLKQYIEKRLLDLECNIEISSKKKYRKLLDENNDMKSMLDKVIINQIEYTNNKIELEKLSEKKERLMIQVNTIAKERADLIKANNELRNKLSKLDNNILRYKN